MPTTYDALVKATNSDDSDSGRLFSPGGMAGNASCTDAPDPLNRVTNFPASGDYLRMLEALTSGQAWFGAIAAFVAATGAVMSVMQWLMNGMVSSDFLLTGFIAALLVASALAALLTGLFERVKADMRDKYDLIRHLQQSEDQTRRRVMASRLALLEYELASDTVRLSEGWSQLIGGAPEPIVTSMAQLSRIIPQDDQPQIRAAIVDTLKGKHSSPRLITHRVRKLDGEIAWIQSEGRVVERCKNGRAVRLMCTSHDITQIKKAEDEIRVAATAFETSEGIIVTDASGSILRVNEAFTKITGYSAEEMYGRSPRVLKSDRQPSEFFTQMWATLGRHGRWTGEIWNRRKNGDVYPEWLRINAVRDRQGVVTHYVGTFTDISDQKRFEANIFQLAYYDQLTSLPNRRLLLDRLCELQVASERTRQFGAVLFLDMDNFKTVNDTLGHRIGDLLLVEVSTRLLAAVRTSDTVSRFGGDEFIVLLEGLGTDREHATEHARMIGDKLIEALGNPYELAGKEVSCSVSIGIELFQGTRQAWDDLFRRSDVAMYSAKQAGRNTQRFFDADMQRAVEQRARLESGLRNALKRDEFVLVFQKQVDAQERAKGAEVLLRWQRPEHGLVSPDEFIHVAEDTGLIVPIGQWVLEKACAQLKAWEGREETRHLMLAVNISAREFKDKRFVDSVRNIISRTGAPSHMLELEITESVLLDDVEHCITQMEALKAIGLTLALDDFGTGYSSLAYVKRLPIDTLKIDRTFVRDLGNNQDNEVIVQTIIQMGQNLGLDVIAEGVEQPQQRAILKQFGCGYYQGYLYGNPERIENFECEFGSAQNADVNCSSSGLS